MKAIRLYGFTEDHGSYAAVTAGFAEAFRASGYGEDKLEVVSLETEPSFDEEPTGIPLADVGIVTGPPNASTRLVQGVRHSERIVMIHPNSSKLPDRMMSGVNSNATLLLASSKWGATVVSRYTTLPVVVVPLGVLSGFREPVEPAPLREAYESGVFRILHLSSTGGERKGTDKLVLAFLDAIKDGTLPATSILHLVLTPQGSSMVMDMMDGTPGWDRVKLTGRLGVQGAPPEIVSRVYGSYHVVCQPSRGEGFGLVPLEALASGTPIVATAATGHSEWFVDELPGAVRVATGAPAPIDDLPGADAPSLDVLDVKDALRRAYGQWYGLKAEATGNAQAIAKRWSWSRSLEGFIKMVG